jgi:O-antigen/teichoic acid export membrane protein
LDKWIYNYFIFWFLFVLFNSFFMIFDWIFRWMEKFKSAMFLDLWWKFIWILSLFYLINNFWIIWAIVSKWIYYIIPVLFLFFYSKKLLSSWTISERQEDWFLKRFFRLSVWMLMFNLFYLFYTRIDIIMLDYYWYKNILGSYDIANQIFLVFQTIFATAALVIAPRIAKLNKIKDYVNIKKHLNKTLLYAFFGSIIIWLVCYYPVAFFVPILFWKYDIGVILSIIKLLLFSLPFMWIRAIISWGFIVPSGNPKILTVSMILMGILNVVLNMLLIPRYWYIWSIAWTITISYIIISLQLCWYIRSLNLNIKKNV